MAKHRVANYVLREQVEGLDITAGELADLLELTVSDICIHFPSKLRKHSDKLGLNDYPSDDDEGEGYDVSSFSEE